MKNNKQENSAHNLALMRGLAKLKSMQQRQEQEQADAIEAHLLATKISLKAPAKAPTPSPALRKVTTSLNLEEMESLHKAQDSAIDANTISYQESANKQSIERAASLLKKATSRNHNESSAPSALAVSALKKKPQISATPELSASFVDSQSQHLKDTNTVITYGDRAHAWPLNEDPLSSTTTAPTTTTTTTSANLAALNATLASQANADIDADADAPTNDSANTHKTNNSTSTEVKEAKANTKTSSSNSETVKSKTKSITKAKAARLNPKDKELHITSGQEHNLSHAQNAQDTTSSAKVLYSASSMQEPNNLDALELNNATMSANVTLDNNQALSIKATSELISATQKVAHSQAPAPSATPKVKPVAANTSDHQNDDALPEAPINSAQIAQSSADNTTTESLPEDIASSSSANREQETEVAAVQENSKDVLKGDKESRTKVKSTKSSLGNNASAGAEVEAGAGASTGAGASAGAGAGAEEQIASEVKPKAKAKGKKGGNSYARNYSEFVRLFGSSSASIKESTVDLIEHVFQKESDILGKRYEYTLKDHEVFCLEQNLFGSGLNLADTGVDKQVSLLELLLVLLSQNQNVLEHRHVSNSSEVKYSFIKRQALTLRRIVFNNPMVERINTSQGTDDEKWLNWQRDFNEFNQKSDANFKLDTNHYHLLKRAFHNFDNFTKAITLLRSWAIVPNKAKAWTEHFLFPFGAESLYYDTTDMLAKGASNHCTNFGQLLFTMLMRAHPNSTPEQQNALLMLCDCFFEQHEGFNVFAQLLGDSFSSGEDEIIAHLRSQLPEDSNSADQSWSSCSNVFKQASQNLLQECEFVPYKEHRCFDQLEEDFRQLLSLNLTKQQLLKSLSVMGMLNILIYFLEQEQRLASINNSKNVPNIDLVLSLGNKASPRVAKLSLDRLQANDKLHSIALNNFITQRLYLLIRCCVSYFKEDLKLDPKEQDLVCNLTRVAFNFVTHKAITIDLNGKGSIYVQDNISSKELASSHKKAHNPLNRVQESQPYPSYKNVLNTISNALMTHTGNNKSPHRDLAIEIGLISGTQKAHQYYSFSDELLRTLVLCCVDKNKSMIMFSEFLQKLYDRYHIVIGPQQAHYYYSSNTQGRSNHIEEKEFKKNLNELIAQLKRMDLLINLSDSCEYVTNPFSIHS